MHTPDASLSRLLELCRASLPAATGVVLATPHGRVLSHEADRVPDPDAIARDAARGPTATSAMVERDGGTYLVVFVPGA